MPDAVTHKVTDSLPVDRNSGSDDHVDEPQSLPIRYDLRILSSIRRMVRAVDVYSRKLSTQFGVTVPQLVCMMKLSESGPLTVKQLASEVYLSPSVVVGIVDRLEKQGIARRERSVVDRRLVGVSLTDKGKEIVSKSPSPLQDNLVNAISELPELECATIALSLEKIVTIMEADSNARQARDEHHDAPILDTTAQLDSNA